MCDSKDFVVKSSLNVEIVLLCIKLKQNLSLFIVTIKSEYTKKMVYREMPYTIFTVMCALGIQRKTTRLISNMKKNQGQ